MATRNSEMPSTPTFQEMPKSPIQLVLADELEAGLAALEVDDQIGDEAQLDDGRPAARAAWPVRSGTRRGRKATTSGRRPAAGTR